MRKLIFKELFTEGYLDGGNAGEYNLARQEQQVGGIPMNYKLGNIKFQVAFIGKSRDLEIKVT